MRNSRIPIMCRTPMNYVYPTQRNISDQKIDEYSQKMLKRMYRSSCFGTQEIKDNEEDILQELKLFLLLLNTEDYNIIQHKFNFYCIDSRNIYKQYEEVNDLKYLNQQEDKSPQSDPQAVIIIQEELKPIIQSMKNNILNQDEYSGFIDNYKVSSPQSEYELMVSVDFYNIPILTQRIQSKETQLILLTFKEDILSVEFKPQTVEILNVYDRLIWSRPDNFESNIKEGLKNYLDNINFWAYVSKAKHKKTS